MKENDWIITRLNNPDFTPAQLSAAGVTPDNTGLLTADQYKKSPVIQEAFKNSETGKFDEAKFNTFYNAQAQDYNNFATKQYQDTLESDYKYARTDTSRPLGAKIRDIKMEVDRVSNPDRLTTGLAAVNLEGDRTQTASEIAQSRSIFNTGTGKFEDETPNDSSLFTNATKWVKSIFNPLVMAQWDQDGTHTDPISGRTVEHKKGQYKVDEDGTYYYETLGDRSAYGKQVKSIWDTVTVDNTPWNKYDFMDSDGLDKSVTGSVAKAAAQIAPMFIPVVGDYYIMGLIADEMADFVPTLAKSVTNLVGGDTPDFLNKIQAVSRSTSTGTSEYAQQHMFAVENFTNLIKDVALQLPEQQMLFKGYTKANELFTKWGVAKDFKSITDDAVKVAKGLPEYKDLSEDAIRGLVQQTSLSKVAAAVTEQQRRAANISLAYMAIISGADTYEQAKQAGFSDFSAALMTWGTISGIYAVDRTGIGEWMFPELTPDVKMFRNTERKLAKNLVDTMAKSSSVAEQETTGWYRKLWDGMTKGTKNYWEKVRTHSLNVGEKMFTEGLEEVSEEVASDAMKVVANATVDLGLTDNRTHIDIQDVGPRYLMNFLGGAIGGGIYTARDIAFGSKYENKNVTKDIIYLARNNKLNDFVAEVKRGREKGIFGNKYLGATPTFDNNGNAIFTTPDANNKSQNDYIADAIINQVAVVQSILNDDPNNKISDHELINSNLRNLSESSKIKKVRDELNQQVNRTVKIEALSNLPDSAIYTSGLLSDYQKAIEDIVEIKRKLATYKGKTDTEISREKREGIKDPEIEKLKADLAEAESLRDSLASGSKAEQYVGMATFVMNPYLSRSYINATFTQYAVAKEHTEYEKISKARLIELQAQYNDYKKTKQNEDIRNAYELFSNFNKVYSPQVVNIAQDQDAYWKERNDFYNKLVDIDKSLDRLKKKDGKVIETKDTEPLLRVSDEEDKLQKDAWKLIYDFVLRKFNTKGKKNFIDNELLSLIDSVMAKTDFTDEKIDPHFSSLDAFVDRFVPDISGLGTEIVHEEDGSFYDIEPYNILSEGPEVKVPAFMSESLLQSILDIWRMLKGRRGGELIFTEINNPLYELLTSIGESINPQGASVFETLKGEQNKLVSFANPSDYFMDAESIINIGNALDAINILESLIYAAQNSKIKSGKIIGFNNTLNEVKQFLGKNDLLGSIRDDIGTIMLHDLDLIHSQLIYFYNLAQQNVSSKLRQHIETEEAVEKAIINKIDKVSLDYKGQSILPSVLPEGTNEEKAAALCNAIYDNVDKISKEQNVEKSEIVKEIFKDAKDKFSNLLGQETTKFNPRVEALTDYDFFMFVITNIAVKDADFSYLLKDVLTNDKTFQFTPFFSQSYAVKMAIGMLLNPTVFDAGLDVINSSVDQHDLMLLLRSVVIDGIGGAGKTSACDALIWRIARKINPNINFMGVVPNETQRANLAKSIFPDSEKEAIKNGTVTTIDNFMETVVDSDTLKKLKEAATNVVSNEFVSFTEKNRTEGGQIAVTDKGNSRIEVASINDTIDEHILENNSLGIVFIDEGTFCNSIYASVISRWARKNNILIVYTGDSMQNGFFKINNNAVLSSIQSESAIAARTSRLDISMRLMNIQKFYNLNSITASFPVFTDPNSSDETYQATSKKILLRYYSGEDEPLAGEKLSDSLTEEDKTLIENMLKSGRTVGCVWDDKNSEVYKFIQDLATNHLYEGQIKFFTADEVQGAEGDYFIIDRHKNFNDLWSNRMQVDAVKDFYTMVTRSMRGTLIFDNENNYRDRFTWSNKSDNTTNPIPNPQASYDEYKENKIKTLSKLVGDNYTPSISIIPPTTQVPITGQLKKVPADVFDEYAEQKGTSEPEDTSSSRGVQGYGFYMRLGGHIEKEENGSKFYTDEKASDSNVTDLNLFISNSVTLAFSIRALRSVRWKLLYGGELSRDDIIDISGAPINKVANLKDGQFGIKVIEYDPRNDEVADKLNPISISKGTIMYTLVYRLKSGTQTYDITLGNLGLPATWENYIKNSPKVDDNDRPALTQELEDYKEWCNAHKTANEFIELNKNNISFAKYTVRAKTNVSYNMEEFEASNPGMKCSPAYIQAEGDHAGKPFVYVWPDVATFEIDEKTVADKYEEQKKKSDDEAKPIKILPVGTIAYKPTAYLDYREGSKEKTFEAILNQLKEGESKASFTKGNDAVNAQILTAMWNWRANLLKLFDTIGITVDADGRFHFTNNDIANITKYQQRGDIKDVAQKFIYLDDKVNITDITDDKKIRDKIEEYNGTLKGNGSIFQLYFSESDDVNAAPGIGVLKDNKVGITVQKALQQFDIIDYMLGMVTGTLNPYLKRSIDDNSTSKVPPLLIVQKNNRNVNANEIIDNTVIRNTSRTVEGVDEDNNTFKMGTSIDTSIALISSLYRYSTSFLDSQKNSTTRSSTITVDGKTITISVENISNFISEWDTKALPQKGSDDNTRRNTYKSTIANMFAMMLNGRIYDEQYGKGGFSGENVRKKTDMCWKDAPFTNGIYFNPKFLGKTVEKHSSYLAVNALNQFTSNVAIEAPKFYISGLKGTSQEKPVPTPVNPTVPPVNPPTKTSTSSDEESPIFTAIIEKLESAIPELNVDDIKKYLKDNNVSFNQDDLANWLNKYLQENEILDRIIQVTPQVLILSKLIPDVITQISNTEEGYKVTYDNGEKRNIYDKTGSYKKPFSQVPKKLIDSLSNNSIFKAANDIFHFTNEDKESILMLIKPDTTSDDVIFDAKELTKAINQRLADKKILDRLLQSGNKVSSLLKVFKKDLQYKIVDEIIDNESGYILKCFDGTEYQVDITSSKVTMKEIEKEESNLVSNNVDNIVIGMSEAFEKELEAAMGSKFWDYENGEMTITKENAEAMAYKIGELVINGKASDDLRSFGSNDLLYSMECK